MSELVVKGLWRAIRVREAGFSSRIVHDLTIDQRDAKYAPDDWGPLPTMGDVADLTNAQLLGRPNFGRKSFKTVRAWIDDRLAEDTVERPGMTP